MNQQFRNEIFKAVKDMVKAKNSEVSMDEKEQILSVMFHDLGDFNGAVLSQMNFMSQYNEDDAEIFQFFSVLSGGVKKEYYEAIETRINELNLNCMFGHFVLHRDLQQIFFRYSIPLKVDDVPYSTKTLQFVWEEIYGIITYFLGYLLIISNEPDFMTLQEYMEDMGEYI